MSVSGILEIKKAELIRPRYQGCDIEWVRIVPVMFDGEPLTTAASNGDGSYLISGFDLPLRESINVLGIFRLESNAPKKFYLAGILLTSR